ncbi:hypothetical protein VFPBJ_01026 [Purpureocillium lilacinum]|uniref:Uncharacterized protein n=1 Tax=Purpureocillium lilacinum TaxID=33203 RepID=A0A179H9P2_PURLI|nr:hypothetical protein VFPBJ_01026 [Purpureocillium lilacinum]
MSLYASSSHGRVGLLGAPEGGTNETLSWKVPVGRLPSTTAQTPAFAPLAPSVRQRRQQAINLLRACRAWLACRLPQPHPHNKTDKNGHDMGCFAGNVGSQTRGRHRASPEDGSYELLRGMAVTSWAESNARRSTIRRYFIARRFSIRACLASGAIDFRVTQQEAA